MGIGIEVMLLPPPKVGAVAGVHQSRYKFTREDTNIIEIESLQA